MLQVITKTCLYNFDPLKPHFYIVKLGFTGVYIISFISAQKHRLWVLVRTASPRWFERVPTIYVLSRNMKNIRVFYLKFFSFLELKFSIYLNRRVFVMIIWSISCVIPEKDTFTIYCHGGHLGCCFIVIFTTSKLVSNKMFHVMSSVCIVVFGEWVDYI